jgi:hypothetical protein
MLIFTHDHTILDAGEGISFIIDCAIVIIYTACGKGACHGDIHGCYIIYWGRDSFISLLSFRLATNNIYMHTLVDLLSEKLAKEI